MKDIAVEEVMLYDVQRILLCIHHRAWSSIAPYCKHLAILGMLQAIKEEREMFPPIMVTRPGDEIV